MNDERDVKPVVIRSTKPDAEKFPDLTQVNNVVLMDGPRARKEAKYSAIKDRNTNEYHHDAVTIVTWRKKREWSEIDEKHTVTLDSDGEDEIQKLLTFLQAVRQGSIAEGSGRYVVLGAGAVPDPKALQSMLNNVNAQGKADALDSVIRQAVSDPEVFSAVMAKASADPHMFAEAGATLNLAAYKLALDELRTLINTPGTREQAYQALLAKYPWIFGSEYSELLDRRHWTRDENQDFVLRRTTDGYIELIEIKTTLDDAALFNHDKSHDSWYAGAELSKVLGQVQKYIENLDADRHSIRAKDKEDPYKIRAKIVIGRNGDEKQVHALRTLNAHLQRIEVITFDQLLNIGDRVLEYLARSLERADKW